jgi:hypothetical protein
MMELSLHGEKVDYNDDAGLRRHSRIEGMRRVKLIKSKDLREALEKFYADLHFFWLKANGVVMVNELRGVTECDAHLLKEFTDYIREVLGQAPPLASATTDEENTDAARGNEEAGSAEGRDPGAPGAGAAGESGERADSGRDQQPQE